MNRKIDTAREFSHRDAADAMKQALAMGRASLGISYETLAVVCDVSASLTKAWCDPQREHCPPGWLVYRLRQKLPLLAAYVETQMEVYARTELKPVVIGFEAQHNVMLSASARWITNHSDALAGDGEYDLAEMDRDESSLSAVIVAAQKALAETHRRKTELRGGNVVAIGGKS